MTSRADKDAGSLTIGFAADACRRRSALGPRSKLAPHMRFPPDGAVQRACQARLAARVRVAREAIRNSSAGAVPTVSIARASERDPSSMPPVRLLLNAVLETKGTRNVRENPGAARFLQAIAASARLRRRARPQQPW